MVLQLALVTALSAPFDVTDWNTRRLSTQRVGMTVLGSWAVANMGVGAVGFALETDERMRWVYLGSLLWNTVNLALAAINLIVEWKVDPASIDAKTGLSNNQKNEKIFWVNAGLDVAYLATSAFLWQRGSTSNDARMVGLGQALLVQGAFLLVFDGVMALLNGGLNDQLIAGLTF